MPLLNLSVRKVVCGGDVVKETTCRYCLRPLATDADFDLAEDIEEKYGRNSPEYDPFNHICWGAYGGCTGEEVDPLTAIEAAYEKGRRAGLQEGVDLAQGTAYYLHGYYVDGVYQQPSIRWDKTKAELTARLSAPSKS